MCCMQGGGNLLSQITSSKPPLFIANLYRYYIVGLSKLIKRSMLRLVCFIQLSQILRIPDHKGDGILALVSSCRRGDCPIG